MGLTFVMFVAMLVSMVAASAPGASAPQSPPLALAKPDLSPLRLDTRQFIEGRRFESRTPSSSRWRNRISTLAAELHSLVIVVAGGLPVSVAAYIRARWRL